MLLLCTPQQIWNDEAQCVRSMRSSKTTGSYESHSCGRHGFTIRGWTNTTRGVLRHDVVEKTQIAMQALMQFLHLRNLDLANSKDTSAVLDQIQTLYPGGIVPCYRFAPAVKPWELSGKISWPKTMQQTPTLQHWWYMNLCKVKTLHLSVWEILYLLN